MSSFSSMSLRNVVPTYKSKRLYTTKTKIALKVQALRNLELSENLAPYQSVPKNPTSASTPWGLATTSRWRPLWGDARWYLVHLTAAVVNKAQEEPRKPADEASSLLEVLINCSKNQRNGMIKYQERHIIELCKWYGTMFRRAEGAQEGPAADETTRYLWQQADSLRWEKVNRVFSTTYFGFLPYFRNKSVFLLFF